MVPSFDGSDDPIWIGGPGEGFGVFVGFGDEAIDGGLEIDEGIEDTPLEAPFCEFGEEAFDGVEPRAGCWREVENKPLVAIEPAPDLWMLMGGVVVEDDVDGLVRRDLSVDHVQEPDELLVPVALHIASDNCPVEDVQGGEERRGSVALVVVGHSAQTPLLHGQARLGAVERLDLAFLVYGQDDGVGGRIDVKPNDIAQFADEVRVVRELELPIAVRLQAMERQMRRTALSLMPVAVAIIAAVQWVASTGGSVSVSASTRSATSGPKGGMRDGRVSSRRRPSTPSSMNRSCQRQTHVFDVPVRRMISCVPTPLSTPE